MKQTSSSRPAESDTTVLVLVALVLVLFLLVAGVSGVGMWQWRRAVESQRMAEMALLEARMAAEQAEHARQVAERHRQEPGMPGPDSVRRSAQAGRLVAAPTVSPWPLLPLLPVVTDGVER